MDVPGWNRNCGSFAMIAFNGIAPLFPSYHPVHHQLSAFGMCISNNGSDSGISAVKIYNRYYITFPNKRHHANSFNAKPERHIFLKHRLHEFLKSAIVKLQLTGGSGK